jgi:phosphate transport system substrate-binding protein
MKRFIITFKKFTKKALFLLALSVVGAGLQGEALAKDITIKGSTTVLPIAQITAEVFMEQHPDVKISVQGGGSGIGIAGIIDGTCDIGDASRSMKEQELSNAVSKGVNPKANFIAMDGIAVIVHPSNKISGTLTKNQLKDIFTGKISGLVGGRRWKSENCGCLPGFASGTFESFGEMALDKPGEIRCFDAGIESGKCFHGVKNSWSYWLCRTGLSYIPGQGANV